jgi:hypothetical protein
MQQGWGAVARKGLMVAKPETQQCSLAEPMPPLGLAHVHRVLSLQPASCPNKCEIHAHFCHNIQILGPHKCHY